MGLIPIVDARFESGRYRAMNLRWPVAHAWSWLAHAWSQLLADLRLSAVIVIALRGSN